MTGSQSLKRAATALVCALVCGLASLPAAGAGDEAGVEGEDCEEGGHAASSQLASRRISAWYSAASERYSAQSSGARRTASS